jgi:4-hydroxy-3-methylbut-2-en-1-yl diphosphate synthase IspG/GcpE
MINVTQHQFNNVEELVNFCVTYFNEMIIYIGEGIVSQNLTDRYDIVNDMLWETLYWENVTLTFDYDEVKLETEVYEKVMLKMFNVNVVYDSVNKRVRKD